MLHHLPLRRICLSALLALAPACGEGGVAGRDAAPAPTTPAITKLAPNAPQLRYEGRFDLSDPSRALFAWPGSAIHANFTGSRIVARLSEGSVPTEYGGKRVHTAYNVRIDQQPAQLIDTASGQTEFVVGDNLPAGPHSITISKRTEASIGLGLFAGLELPAGGSFVPASAAPGRTIEFIGDSGLTGYGAAQSVTAANMCAFSPASEDADLSYARQAGDALGAAVINVSYSGKGISRNLADEDNVKMLPLLWGRIVPDDASKIYNFDQYQPDVVVLDAGGNDFVGNGDAAVAPPRAPFIAAYLAFLKQIRARYPNARIVCTISPNIIDGTRAQLDNFLNASDGALALFKDSKTLYLPFAAYDVSVGYGCDYHPNAAGHARTAQALVAQLRTLMGW